MSLILSETTRSIILWFLLFDKLSASDGLLNPGSSGQINFYNFVEHF